MVQVGHVKAARIVAHAAEQELQPKIKRARAACHSFWIEDPLIDQQAIAIEKFADRELSRHRLAVQERRQEVRGKSLHVVNTIALRVERARLPVRSLD